MRKRRLLAISAAVLELGISWGVSAPALEVSEKPKPPFVMKTPESGTWTISINAPHAAPTTKEALPLPAGEKVKISYPVSVAVAKTGDIVSEVWTYSDGATTQRWAFQGAQIEELQGGTELFRRIPDAKSFDLFNYREKEFPHYWWVTTENFNSVEVVAGRPCNVFQDTVMIGGHSDAAIEELSSVLTAAPGEAKASLYASAQPCKVVAYIDAETLQPLLIKIDAETRAYKYGPPPTSPLVLPSRFQAELDSWIGSLKATNRPHKAP